MIINQANLVTLYRTFMATFQAAYESLTPKSFYARVATVVPSTTKQNDYGWLGKFPKMREWLGDRVVKGLSLSSYSIKNKDFESTIAVDRNDLDDDNIGIYTPMVQGLASAASTHPDELIADLIIGGFTGLCYDSQYFFDTDHPVGTGTASNKSTAPLSLNAYQSARATMMKLTDEEGRPLGITPNMILVPPDLGPLAEQLFSVPFLAGGGTNPNYNKVEVVEVPWLASYPTRWFLLDTTRPLKPFIFQRRKEPTFVAKTDPSGDNLFMKKEYIFGVDSRDNAGYGLWQLAYGSLGDNS